MNKTIFFEEDHNIEITIQETHQEEIPIKQSKDEDHLDCDGTFKIEKNNYSMSSRLHCTIKYYIDNTITPITVDMGDLSHITSNVVNTNSSELKSNQIITTGKMFTSDNNVDSLKLFTHHLKSNDQATYIASSEHIHQISYHSDHTWTHRYCGVAINLTLSEKSTKKFADEFVKLLESLDAFYINHFASLQSQYLSYLNITSPSVLVHTMPMTELCNI